MATSPEDGATTDAPKKKRTKLMLMLAAVLLLVAGAAAGAFFAFGRGQPTEDGAAAKRPEPTYLALEPFTVNLSGADSDRYALVGVTLELRQPKIAEQLRTFMPAVRSQILLAMTQKTAEQLLAPDGKTQLAAQIQQAAARALGTGSAGTPGSGGQMAAPPAPASGPWVLDPTLPVSAVHFSQFIIQ